MAELNETAQKILDVAENFTQTRGFNAFSYKDIQHELGIKTSSIHYYFPTKQDLAREMAKRYVDRLSGVLDAIYKGYATAEERIKNHHDVFLATFRRNGFCLCGMLASDITALSEAADKELQRFFDLTESWIAKVLIEGQSKKEVKEHLDAEEEASLILSSFEGGMLIARAKNNEKYFDKVAKNIMAHILT